MGWNQIAFLICVLSALLLGAVAIILGLLGHQLLAIGLLAAATASLSIGFLLTRAGGSYE